MFAKISKKAIFILVIIIVGGLGGIIADRYLFPYLNSTKLFSKYEFLKKSAENVTIINKTEQVFVKEETSINKITSQVSSAVVNIVSYPAPGSKTTSKKGISAGNSKNGTGMIVTSDGMVMTYASAINTENSNYKVMVYDGNVYDAELLGIDSYGNLAFLKINANNLPVVSFADSRDAQPGEKVIAVGNSAEIYANRYAGGLLSSFEPTYNLAGKALSSSEKLEGVFRTDFNSQDYYVGGPVIDYAGQVIAITGSLEKDNAREFFQIPSNKAKAVIERAIKKELNNAVQLGIYFVPLTKTYALANNLQLEKGAMIYSPSGQQGLAVIFGSPAQKAGFQINDVIVAVNGKEINSDNTLPDILSDYKKGEEAEFLVIRDGKEIKINTEF